MWADRAVNCASDLGAFQNKKQTSRVRVIGKKGDTKCDSKVRPVPRRLTAFVGRLHIDTAESDLQEFLSEAGVVDVKCKKLTPRNGLTF